VHFDGFYAVALQASRPKLKGAAFGVVRDSRLLDASASARRLGLLPGITLAEARSVARAAVRWGAAPALLDYDPEDFEPYARKWLDACLAYTNTVEPVGQESAFLDLGTLPGAEEVADALTQDLYFAVGICPRVGIARTVLAARVAAEVCPGQPVFRDGEFLAPLTVDCLWQVRPEHRVRLAFLGFRTVGDVAALPTETLVRQFGREGVRISLLARGRDSTRVRALYPLDEVYARVAFPQPARLDQELEVGVHRLARRLSEMLRARDSQARAVVLSVEFDGFRVVQGRRTFTRPLQSAGSLMSALRLTLRQVVIKEEVFALAARLPEIEPVSTSQLRLSLTEGAEGEMPASVEDQLRCRFGRSALRRASEVPASRRERFLRLLREGPTTPRFADRISLPDGKETQ